MSNRHLPAGQNIQGGPGVMPGTDMGGNPRRRQPQYMPPQYHQPMAPMYPNYMPYAPQQYYGMPPQFPNGGMPAPGYMPYQNYGRSPPAMHQYVPMVGVSVPPNYPRPAQQQSPNLATPYQPPSGPSPMPPQTPSSTHSSQMIPPPTPPTPQTIEQPTPSQSVATESVVSEERQPFRPPLPWLSKPDSTFPERAPRSRRRRRQFKDGSKAVSLPAFAVGVEQSEAAAEPSAAPATVGSKPDNTTVQPVEGEQSGSSKSELTPASKPAHGAPVTPVVPKRSPKAAAAETNGDSAKATADGGSIFPVNGEDSAAPDAIDQSEATVDLEATSPPVKAAPTSWANLFSKPASKAATSQGGEAEEVNGDSAESAMVGGAASAFSKANASSLAEAIRSYRVDSADKVSLLEPRGLINTGNMCYMNSVLQVLMFCVPFYDFLDQVSRRAVHSFKSETPLVDAMVMFMHEYKVLASSSSTDRLRKSLKTEDFEKYGEPFTPEFVYEAIRLLSRFASMRRGHQQDAEEFLGFLLQSLDDECTHVMNTSLGSDAGADTPDTQSVHDGADPTGDWLEVGRKQKAAVSRTSGSNSSTPISKIFGGLLRSEFRVPGLKDSITTEPYQPLQLDIGSPDVRNVVDALRGLTHPERLQGDFNSPRGKDIVATKQVFIESLPPVLILHLKRFQFDAEGHGTIKIWKKIGYPLELEIPREALSRQRRTTIGSGPMPKYKLISVVYHHGKNASGGHYTADVRRQDGREWIRMDDTVLRRVRSEDVAEGGSEEDIKDTRKEQNATGASANRFGAMNDEDTGDEGGWSEVTTSASGHKKWSSVVNGAGAKDNKQAKDNIKDNKVAYLLFYQRM